jgi:hypothetical protein
LNSLDFWPLGAGIHLRRDTIIPQWFQGSKAAALLLDSGVFCSNVGRELQLIFQTIAKEGLQGGEGDKSRVIRHRHIHDPGIQQEPSRKSESGARAQLIQEEVFAYEWVCVGSTRTRENGSTCRDSHESRCRLPTRAGERPVPQLIGEPDKSAPHTRGRESPFRIQRV